MNIRELRNMFPALSRTVYGKQLVYFDNAATAQRSQSVIDKWTQLTIGANANIHRAVYKLAVDAQMNMKAHAMLSRNILTPPLAKR